MGEAASPGYIPRCIPGEATSSIYKIYKQVHSSLGNAPYESKCIGDSTQTKIRVAEYSAILI